MAPELNGVANGVKPTFLFTSESVGEGHPDKIAFVAQPCGVDRHT